MGDVDPALAAAPALLSVHLKRLTLMTLMESMKGINKNRTRRIQIKQNGPKWQTTKMAKEPGRRGGSVNDVRVSVAAAACRLQQCVRQKTLRHLVASQAVADGLWACMAFVTDTAAGVYVCVV